MKCPLTLGGGETIVNQNGKWKGFVFSDKNTLKKVNKFFSEKKNNIKKKVKKIFFSNFFVQKVTRVCSNCFFDFKNFCLYIFIRLSGVINRKMSVSPPLKYSKVPPPRTVAGSPPVGQTLGSGEPPEGRSLVTNALWKKNTVDTSVRSTARRSA